MTKQEKLSQLLEMQHDAGKDAKRAYRRYESARRESAKAMTSLLEPEGSKLTKARMQADKANAEFIRAREALNNFEEARLSKSRSGKEKK